MGEYGGNLVSHSFNQERCRKAVARMCIKDNQPFSIVEDEGFSELVWELNSEFELPSRWTVARDTLLELTDRDYASYFNNETEDGEEGTRMIHKTKKKKKNVVGVPNEDDCLPLCYLLQISTAIVLFAATCKKMLNVVATDVVLFAAIDLVTMHAAISKMCRHADENKRKIALSMKAKYDKYWDNLDNMNVLFEDDCSMKIDLDDGFSKYLETQYGEGDDFTEVDIYLKDGAEKRGDNSFDVLGWWNQIMAKFSILSQVAKHVLAMSISTVALDSAFSTGGRVIDKYRSSLMPKTAQALICNKPSSSSDRLGLGFGSFPPLPLEEMVEILEKLELGSAWREAENRAYSIVRRLLLLEVIKFEVKQHMCCVYV
ncbi:zinc finger BED domain-containing protein RICESLEEPER 2-like protein [Tanacetum coccineum]